MTYVILFAVVFLIGLVVASSGGHHVWTRWALLGVLAFIALVVETGTVADPISTHSWLLTIVMFCAFFLTGLLGEMLGVALRKSGFRRTNA